MKTRTDTVWIECIVTKRLYTELLLTDQMPCVQQLGTPNKSLHDRLVWRKLLRYPAALDWISTMDRLIQQHPTEMLLYTHGNFREAYGNKQLLFCAP